jgi:DNA repair exonuclease SbcCD ATPase subunit
MKAVLLVVLLVVGACVRGPTFLGSRPAPNAESHYRTALEQLDPSNPRGSLDSALASLNRYLASSERPEHLREARVLHRLASEAKQLARVEAAIHSKAAAATTTSEPKARESESRPSDESVKEIQRLREELKEANAELERIRKRLTAPKP